MPYPMALQKKFQKCEKDKKESIKHMENKAKIEKICKYACDKGYRFEFFEDILSK